jgi:hypothetical protein
LGNVISLRHIETLIVRVDCNPFGVATRVDDGWSAVCRGTGKWKGVGGILDDLPGRLLRHVEIALIVYRQAAGFVWVRYRRKFNVGWAEDLDAAIAGARRIDIALRVDSRSTGMVEFRDVERRIPSVRRRTGLGKRRGYGQDQDQAEQA